MANLKDGAAYLKQILPHGFESFQLTNWQYLPEGIDFAETAKQIKDTIGDKAVISTLGVYGNPLQDEKTAAQAENTRYRSAIIATRP